MFKILYRLLFLVIILVVIFVAAIYFKPQLVNNSLINKAFLAVEHSSCKNIESQVNYSPPKINDANNNKIIIIGDSGKPGKQLENITKSIQAVCQQKGCDFGVILGDNFYENGVKSIDDPLFDKAFNDNLGKIGIKYFAVLGNHDIIFKDSPYSEVQYSSKNSSWIMPNFQYYFETNLADFYALNSNCLISDYSFFSKNYKKNDKWQILLMHHSLYSTGSHGDSDALKLKLWRNDLKNNVDLALSGHNHILELLEKNNLKTTFVTSGAASKFEPEISKSKADELFVYRDGGFVYANLSSNEATLNYYDQLGNELYTKTITRKK